MPPKTFATKEAAAAEIKQMKGWDAHASQLFQPQDENSDTDGCVHVIEVTVGDSDPQYMQNNGYVR